MESMALPFPWCTLQAPTFRSKRVTKSWIQWVNLRENRNRKPLIVPWFLWDFPVIFPNKTNQIDGWHPGSKTWMASCQHLEKWRCPATAVPLRQPTSSWGIPHVWNMYGNPQETIIWMLDSHGCAPNPFLDGMFHYYCYYHHHHVSIITIVLF